jgi:hypothetical protein
MRVISIIALFVCLVACQSGPSKQAESKDKDTPPKLLKPQVKKNWVPPEIQDGGRIYIDGHWRYEVERATSFGR